VLGKVYSVVLVVLLLLLLLNTLDLRFPTLGSSDHIPGNVTLSVRRGHKLANTLFLDRVTTSDLPGSVYKFGAFNLAHRPPLQFGWLW